MFWKSDIAGVYDGPHVSLDWLLNQSADARRET